MSLTSSSVMLSMAPPAAQQISPPLPSLCPASIKCRTSSWSLASCNFAGVLGVKRVQRSRQLLVGKTGGSIRCQAGSPSNTEEGFLPQAEFYKVEAILRPWRVSHVASGLLKLGIRGVTVTDVRGIGAQGGSRERQAGSEFYEDSFVSKVKMEVVVSKDQVDVVIDAIIDQARTGEIGDGKIFVIPVADIIRVRTGERGLKAERMAGGRADLLSASNGNGLS